MSEILSKAKEQWLYWRILIIRMLLFSLIQLGAAWQTSTANINITSLGFWEKVTLGVGIFVTWGGTMLALLDQTMSRLSKGQPPTSSGDTQLFTKEPPPAPPQPS